MKTLAFNSGKRLALFAVALFMALRVHADGHSTIEGTAEGLLLFGNPPMFFFDGGGLPVVVDVYSDRGTLVTEVETSDGFFRVENLKAGTYTLVASNNSTLFLLPPPSGLSLTGSFETATQTVSIGKKTTIFVEFILDFVPAGT